ncbi:MAG TPA: DUF4105 domain-containing protein [Longimicrobium sp.]|uniref:lipoprotein N-acyltransferase Lnb domain-containing protein n=1 Tax=Longimicrobium sp. TaxID=2029185 RepID=UPI002EDB903D
MLRWTRNALLCLVAALALGWAALRLSTNPSHARTWRTEQRVLPRVALTDSVVTVRNVRDFTFRTATDFTPGYRDRRYDLRKIERVWFVLSPFNPDWRGPAHSFLSFSFSDSQYVSVSVEARREADEDYSVWMGALRQYELMYVIGEERDVIGLRAVTWNDPVYLYPVRATPEQARALFVSMMRRAQALERRPDFYNTFTNNCTTNILDPVNEMRTEPIRFGMDVLLPGYSDELAYRHGLIDTELPLEQARERFRINERAQAAAGRPDFSARIRMIEKKPASPAAAR